LLKILKVNFDSFAIRSFEFHALIIETANAGSRGYEKIRFTR